MSAKYVFFAARNMVNCSLGPIDEARDWMRRHTMPLIDPRTLMSNYAGRKMMVDVRIKKYILDFIHRADYNITDVSVEKKVEPIPADFRDFLMNEGDLSKEDKKKSKPSVMPPALTDLCTMLYDVIGKPLEGKTTPPSIRRGYTLPSPNASRGSSRVKTLKASRQK